MMSVSFNSTNSLEETNYKDEDLLTIIQGLDINRVHGHVNLSVRMAKKRISNHWTSLSMI